MNGKPWSKQDIYRLYGYAESISQTVAAERLGRSLQAVQTKAKLLGIRWRQGTVSLNQIAEELGCSQSTVARSADILIDDWNKKRYGNKNGKRYLLRDGDAERIRRVLSRTLQVRNAHRVAGRKRSKRMTAEES